MRAALDAARELAAEHGISIATLRELLNPESTDGRATGRTRCARTISARSPSPVAAPISSAPRELDLRKGSTLVGPTGATEKLSSGFFREIQDVAEKLCGTRALVDDPFLVAKSYIASVTHAASVNKLFRSLAERGVIVPASAELVGSLKVTGGAVGGGDPVRAIWTQPEDAAADACARPTRLAPAWRASWQRCWRSAPTRWRTSQDRGDPVPAGRAQDRPRGRDRRPARVRSQRTGPAARGQARHRVARAEAEQAFKVERREAWPPSRRASATRGASEPRPRRCSPAQGQPSGHPGRDRPALRQPAAQPQADPRGSSLPA